MEQKPESEILKEVYAALEKDDRGYIMQKYALHRYLMSITRNKTVRKHQDELAQCLHPLIRILVGVLGNKTLDERAAEVIARYKVIRDTWLSEVPGEEYWRERLPSIEEMMRPENQYGKHLYKQLGLQHGLLDGLFEAAAIALALLAQIREEYWGVFLKKKYRLCEDYLEGFLNK